MDGGRLDRAALARLRQGLARYETVLPSLEMKRRQISEEVSVARRRLVTIERERERALDDAARSVPMVARSPALPALDVTAVNLTHEFRYGIRLPCISGVTVSGLAERGFLSSPVWTDELVEYARALTVLGVRERVERIRIARLEQALTETVRRVNLFERVLIPEVRASIRRIVVAISDAGRDALVRARQAKRHGTWRGDA